MNVAFGSVLYDFIIASLASQPQRHSLNTEGNFKLYVRLLLVKDDSIKCSGKIFNLVEDLIQRPKSDHEKGQRISNECKLMTFVGLVYR